VFLCVFSSVVQFIAWKDSTAKLDVNSAHTLTCFAFGIHTN